MEKELELYDDEIKVAQHSSDESSNLNNNQLQLPDTVEVLIAENGAKVYLIGTAHFSESSKEDVAKIIRLVQPNVVMVELCRNRLSILSLDEETLLREAKNISLEKISNSIKQNGVVQGILQILFLSMSANITKQLGIAPGGEFRTAFDEAKKVKNCKLHLGDRPIEITLQRALGSLAWYQKIYLGLSMLFSRDKISKEDIEKCKQKDLLEELLKEITGDYPSLSRVIVEERDIYLTHSLKLATTFPDDSNLNSNEDLSISKELRPVVGVVGIGHLPGIVANWPLNNEISEIIKIPKPTLLGTLFRKFIKLSLLGFTGIVVWKLGKLTLSFFHD